ncbi:hypothetical protein P154DRAFT_432027, partial [Amniculicola lignicola CBS 123094]
EEEVSINVDALVNDTDFPIPPKPLTIGSQTLEQPRRATPTIPPGFTAPAVPKLPDHSSLPMSRTTSTNILPAVPVIPLTPLRAATPVKSKEREKEKKTVQTPEAAVSQSTSNAVPVASRKIETPTKSGRKGSTKSQGSVEVSKRKKAEEASPFVDEKAKGSSSVPPEHKSPAKDAVGKGTPKGKASSKKFQISVPPEPSASKDVTSESALSATISSSFKRQHPGKLDIAAATKLPEADVSFAVSLPRSDTQQKSMRTVSLAVSGSVPASPAATSTGSPIKRTSAPRTLRVVQTPRTEIPPPLSAVSTTSLPHFPTVDKLRSRQASIASINLPGTPASEMISEDASVTSTSVSRASSPPPIGGKVGTAPVRKKTKSQAKKDRQDRARQIAEEEAMALEENVKSDQETIHAPIVGRKKKAKKPSSSVPKTAAAPIKSQPPSPKSAIVEEEEDGREDESAPVSEPSKPSITKASVSSPRKAPSPPKPELLDDTELFREKPQPTPQSILAELQKTGELLVSTLEFFKPLTASLAHAARTSQPAIGAAPPDLKIHFSENDLDALARKKPVRLRAQDPKSDSRTLITPQGKFFWGLTQELEEKALELEKQIEELKGSACFHSRKRSPEVHSHHAASAHAQSKDVLPAIATALKEAGAKLSKSASSSSSSPLPKLDPASTLLGSTSVALPGAPLEPKTSSALPSHGGPNSQFQSQNMQTPADAIAYLNQFVLPKSDNPPIPRKEMDAVGGPPGSGLANMTVNLPKMAKAARVVAGGGVGGGDIEGIGSMAADLLGGVVVQGLEALVGAGLGFNGMGGDLGLGVDARGNVTLGGAGVDASSLVGAFESEYGSGSFGHAGYGASVLGMEEAEMAMSAARKDHEALEKKLGAVMKRNKKMVGGVGK